MQEYLVQGSLNLKRSSVLRVEDGRGILIYVWEGELWITEDGERSDRIVRRGEWGRRGATSRFAREATGARRGRSATSAGCSARVLSSEHAS